MLEVLHIENIAIIESAEITFERGFNALTGETGAGKSIVIDAMSAVLGQRTSRELIRTGADKAYVSAWFSGVDEALCSDLGFAPDEDGNLMLQREIYADGKNVCRVGGRPLTVSQLKTLGQRLLNIHGQHDGQQLLDETQHLLYLDRFAKDEKHLAAYAEKYYHFTEIQRKIASLKMDEAEKMRRMDTLQYQIEELEKANIRVGEEEELSARRTLLRNGEKLLGALSEGDYCLNGDDSSNGAVTLVKQAQSALAGIRNLDDAFGSLYERLEAVYSELYDVADTLRDQKDALSFSPGELDEIEAARFEDHVAIKLISPAHTVDVVMALTDKSKDAFIGLTGENCHIKNITVQDTGETVKQGDIRRIAEDIDFINRMESDLPNIQIDHNRSASTEGIAVEDEMKIDFHTVSLPGSNLVWYCPYIVIFYSGDRIPFGEDYREYALIKFNGECTGDKSYAENRLNVKKNASFPGWDAWKELNREGLECSVELFRSGNTVTVRTQNLGIEIENTTVIRDDRKDIFVSLTGDHVALTDIRI